MSSMCLLDSRALGLHFRAEAGSGEGFAVFLVRTPEGKWPLTLGNFCSKFPKAIR